MKKKIKKKFKRKFIGHFCLLLVSVFLILETLETNLYIFFFILFIFLGPFDSFFIQIANKFLFKKKYSHRKKILKKIQIASHECNKYKHFNTSPTPNGNQQKKKRKKFTNIFDENESTQRQTCML